MTLQINLNLLADNNGVAGEPLSRDRIAANDSFFVEIEVADLRDDAAGVIGLTLDIEWDVFVLDALNVEITDKLSFNPQGTIDIDNDWSLINERGLIEDLGAGAIPNFDLGEAVGINELERFALIHFQGELQTDDPTPLTVTVSDPRNVAFADGTPFNSNDVEIEAQTLSITSPSENTPPTLENPIADLVTPEDSEFSLTIADNTFNDADAGDTLTYSATLADGSALPAWLSFDADTKTFSGTPESQNVGNLEVAVTATDNSGEAISDTFTLTVQRVDDPPFVARELENLTVDEDAEDSVIDLSNVFSDTDNDDAAIVKTVLANSNENLVAASIENNNLTLDYQDNQSGTAEITVRGESNGKTVEDTFTVTVNEVTLTNTSPTLENPIADLVTLEDSEFSLTIPTDTFNDADAGDTLTYSATLADGSALPAWLSFDANIRTFSGTPRNSDVGSLELAVTATDTGNEMVSDTFTLAVENVDDAPKIQNAVAPVTVDEDSENTVIDLSNTFTDIDNDDTTIVKTVAANTNDGLVIASIENNSLTLDYQDNQFGSADITVRGTSNEEIVENTFNVNVNAVDDRPVVNNPIADVTVAENADDRTIDLSDTFSDADGDEITLAVQSNSNQTLLTPTLEGDNLTLDFVDEQFGTADITVRGESNGQTVEDTFSVTVNEVVRENNSPTLENPIADLVTLEDSEFSFTVPADTFADADAGDTLTYSATLEDGSALPAWLSFDANIRTFSGTPGDSDVGSLEVAVTATDTGNEMVSDTFSLAVENVDDAPKVKNAIAPFSVDEDSENTVIDLSNTFTDIDNDDTAIVKTVLYNSNDDLVTTSINGNNLILDYQDNQFGTAEIYVRGESNGRTKTNSFKLEVKPIDDAPIVSNEIADINVDEGAENQTIDLTNVFNDIDGDEITLAVKSNSNETLVGTALDGNNLTLNFLDEQFGNAEITIEATANGQKIEDTFTVSIAAIETPTQSNLALTEVHRFFQFQNGFHFYTADDNESNVIQSQSELGNLNYNYEGESFAALTSNVDSLTGEIIEDAEEVYRFFNKDTGAHLFTMDINEKNYILDNLDNYTLEGTAYYAFTEEQENIETIPIYRLYNGQTDTHLLTTDTNEVNYIQENLSHFSLEGDNGIAFYVMEL